MDPLFQRFGDVTIQRLEKPKDKVGLQSGRDIVEKENKDETSSENVNIDDVQGVKRTFEDVASSSNKKLKFDKCDIKKLNDETSNNSFSENEMSDYESESEIESDEDISALKSQNSNVESATSEPETSTDFLEKLVQEPFDEQEMKPVNEIKTEIDDYDYDIKEKLKEMGEISFETVKKGEKPKKAETYTENEVVVTPAKKPGSLDDDIGERKSGNLRRNIREVMDETKLDESTLAAQRQEMERLRRVQEQQRLIREVQRQMAQDRVISLLQGNVPKPGTSGGRIGSTVLVKLPNGQTKAMTKLSKRPFELLRVPKTSVPTHKNLKNFITIKKSPGNLTPSVSIAPVIKKPPPFARPPSDTDSDNEEFLLRKPIARPKTKDPVPTIDISSDDDCIVVSESENDPNSDEGDDPGNSGMHTNDEFNQPDEQGRVVVNIGHPEGEADIYVAAQISRIIKPHQIGGVRFLFDNVIESVSRFETSTGFGCILAHSMGLGKTLQVVCFSDIFLRHTSARTILCIMPINTLQNWLAEYNMWLPKESAAGNSPLIAHGEVRPRNFNLHVLNDSHKTLAARARVIHEWKVGGGVLLIGYEQYRLLSLRKHPKSRKKPIPQETHDDDKNKVLFDDIHEALVEPGPDLVICDEGHRIKNSHASISQALKQMRTKRRVVLTGYPLQNNLMEYWCMVDFVRPNYLGSKTEFCNMFERPIQNGQCIDSTEADIKLMRYRAHVLHSLLVGFVQRRSHTVLQTALPQKEEYVLLVRMTDFQRTLYETFMNEVVRTQTVPNPLKAFAVCCKIWNHPDVLYYFLKKQAGGDAVDIDLEEVSNSTASSNDTSVKSRKGCRKSAPKGKNSGKPAASVTPYNSSADLSSNDKQKDRNLSSAKSTRVPVNQQDNSFPAIPVCCDSPNPSVPYKQTVGYKFNQDPNRFPSSTQQPTNFSQNIPGNYENNPQVNYTPHHSTANCNDNNQSAQSGQRIGSQDVYSQSDQPANSTNASVNFSLKGNQFDISSDNQPESFPSTNQRCSFSQNNQPIGYSQVNTPANSQSPSISETTSCENFPAQLQQKPDVNFPQKQLTNFPESQVSTFLQGGSLTQNQLSPINQSASFSPNNQQDTFPAEKYQTNLPEQFCSKQGENFRSDQANNFSDGSFSQSGNLCNFPASSQCGNFQSTDADKFVQSSRPTTYNQNSQVDTFTQSGQPNSFNENRQSDNLIQTSQSIAYSQGGQSSVNFNLENQTGGFPNSNTSEAFSSNSQPDGFVSTRKNNVQPKSQDENVQSDNRESNFSSDNTSVNFSHGIQVSSDKPGNFQTNVQTANFPQTSDFPADSQSDNFSVENVSSQIPPVSYRTNKNFTSNQNQSENFPQTTQSSRNDLSDDFPLTGQAGGFSQNKSGNFSSSGQSNHLQTTNQEGGFAADNSTGNFLQNRQSPAFIANSPDGAGQQFQPSNNFPNYQQNYWAAQNTSFKEPNEPYNNFRPPYNHNYNLQQNQQWIKKEDVKPMISNNIITNPIKTEMGASDTKPKINIISDIKLSTGFDVKKINILRDIKLESKVELHDLKEEQPEGKFDPKYEPKLEVGDEDAKLHAESPAPSKVADAGIPYDWAIELLKDYVPGCIENSSKMEILFCIIRESIALGDRLLVFSQSLITLDLIEQFLQMNFVPGESYNWTKNLNYYRLDGSTSALEREKLINEFNSNSKIHLFLVSTRAGSLGINLVGANRVVVLDASWNPCHDTQAVCRVYRYGQRKPCFVYRLVVDNCLEKKIYDRQINKQGMSDRVVDECNPDAHLTMKDVSTLCWDDAEEEEARDWSAYKDNYIDVVLQKVLVQYGTRLNKEPFQHESLLVDRKDKQLSQQEKRLAKKGYEREKQAARQPAYNVASASRGHRPVASVRPMQQGGDRPTRWIPAEHWQRQGMTAQEMTLPLDVVIPTNQPDKGNIVLKAGQKVLVLKSPKGVYMQLESGKIVAIKTAIKVRGKAEEDVLKVKPSLPPCIKNNAAISVLPQKRAVKPFTPGLPRLNMRSIKQAVPNLISRIQSVTKKVQMAKTKPYQIGHEIARAINQSKVETESHPSSSDEEKVHVEKRHFNFSKESGLTIEPRIKVNPNDDSRICILEHKEGVQVEIAPHNSKSKTYLHGGYLKGNAKPSGSALEQLEQSASAIMSDSKQPFQETLDSITSTYQEEEKLSDTSSHASTTHSANQSSHSISSSDHEVIPVEDQHYQHDSESHTSVVAAESIKSDIPAPDYSYSNYYGYNHMQPYPPPHQGYPGYPPQPPPYDMMGYPPQQPQYPYGMYPPQNYPPQAQYHPQGPYDYGQPPPQPPVYGGYSPYPHQQYPPPPHPQAMYPPPPTAPTPGYPEYQYNSGPPPPSGTAAPPATPFYPGH